MAPFVSSSCEAQAAGRALNQALSRARGSGWEILWRCAVPFPSGAWLCHSQTLPFLIFFDNSSEKGICVLFWMMLTLRDMRGRVLDLHGGIVAQQRQVRFMSVCMCMHSEVCSLDIDPWPVSPISLSPAGLRRGALQGKLIKLLPGRVSLVRKGLGMAGAVADETLRAYLLHLRAIFVPVYKTTDCIR